MLLKNKHKKLKKNRKDDAQEIRSQLSLILSVVLKAQTAPNDQLGKRDSGDDLRDRITFLG